MWTGMGGVWGARVVRKAVALERDVYLIRVTETIKYVT